MSSVSLLIAVLVTGVPVLAPKSPKRGWPAMPSFHAGGFRRPEFQSTLFYCAYNQVTSVNLGARCTGGSRWAAVAWGT